ncbi:MAG: peptidase MA family metallohydrolase [Gemmatimonadaceae bacterium]
MRIGSGRFTVVAYPGDQQLARSLLDHAVAHDSFPGLARPTQPILLAVAPNERRFREWAGPSVPEWGVAIAMPGEGRIVMQGRSASSEAGDPVRVLRHELAHLALHEVLDGLPPRWFDEGYASYAAGEWGREEALATSMALAMRRIPSLDSLDNEFYSGSGRAAAAYALAYRAVSDMARLDAERGLALFFRYWAEEAEMERAFRAAYGMTLHDFERSWKERTIRRYGVIALVADFTLVIGLFMLLVVPLYLTRRKRDRRRLAILVAADEASERAARESAVEELLLGLPQSSRNNKPPSAPPTAPSP